MRHVTRPVALFVAAILLVGGPAGASAQSTASDEMGVVLIRHLCAIEIAYGGGGFGTWEYVGWSGYAHVGGPTTTQIDGTILSTPPQGGCSVTVAFDGLYFQGPPPQLEGGFEPIDHLAPDTSFSAYSAFSGAAVDPSGWTESGVTGPDYDFEFTMRAAPLGAPPGTWTGHIDVYIADAV